VHYLGNSSDFMYATQCIYLGNYTNLKKKFKQRLFTEVFSLGDVLLLILTALATLSLICVPFLLLVLQKCVHKLVDVLFFSACKFLQQINTITCSTSVRLLTFFLHIQSFQFLIHSEIKTFLFLLQIWCLVIRKFIRSSSAAV